MGCSAAPSIAKERLRRRTDFLAASAATALPTTAFVLQARRRNDNGPVRIGFTVSKKVGNAVERNRVRRRLREIVRLASPERLRPGHDYVLVGRRAALSVPFDRMAVEFDKAMQRIGGKRSVVGKATARDETDGRKRGASSATDH